MKKYIILLLVIVSGIIYLVINNITKLEGNKEMEITLIINNRELNVSLEDNLATHKLIDILKEREIVIDASDYGNFEKVGPLNYNFPTSDEKITTTYGDIVLYNGNEISIFYNSNTWNYTKIGHINNVTKEELISILGKGDVTITFKLR